MRNLIFLVSGLVFFAGCQSSANVRNVSAPVAVDQAVLYKPFGSGEPPDVSVLGWDLTLTQLPGGPTLTDLENDTDPDNPTPVSISGTLRDLSNGQAYPVAVRLRGHSTRLSGQKSYRISINRDAPAWRGTREILLNKHPYDLSRVRNKLSFDLLQALPELSAPAVRFATLRIDGVDHGFFTQIERPDKAWLQARGLDAKGWLYKAEQFEFDMAEPLMKLKTQPSYDRGKFETILSIFGSDDHARLQAMLKDVNDDTVPINRVIERHFDRANYITWLAFNILTANLDTNSQNFYLYAPREGGSWLFLPWDYDGAWGFYEQPDQRGQEKNRLASWQTGPANWWGVKLHRRFLAQPQNRAQLLERLNQLAKSFFQEARLQMMLDAYEPVVRAANALEPDRSNLPVASAELDAEWQAELRRLRTVPARELQHFLKEAERPMPFHLGNPEIQPEGIRFSWEASEDWQGDPITYDLKLARDPSFRQLLFQQTGLQNTAFQSDLRLPAGKYYWQVLSRDSAKNWQSAFEVLLPSANEGSISGAATFDIP